MRSVHFIAGLPRSGSTLLAALFRQNPAITAGMTSPLCHLVRTLLREISGGECAVWFDRPRRADLLRGVFESYYRDAADVIDTCRTWTSSLPLLAELYPDSKVLCCVRPVGWIVNSLELAQQRDPTRTTSLIGWHTDMTVYERAEFVMNRERGMVGRAYDSLKEAWFGPQAHRLILVDYEELTSSPTRVMAELYRQLGFEPFESDFEHVEFEAAQFDERIAAPDLHRICGPVRAARQTLVIPPDLFARYADACFWQSWRKPRAVA